jgi:hypothetical protein
MYALTMWRKHYRNSDELRAMMKEREGLIEHAIGHAYERGWNDRTAFTHSVYAHVQPAARRPN